MDSSTFPQIPSQTQSLENLTLNSLDPLQPQRELTSSFRSTDFQELVFIDQAVADYEQLVNQLPPEVDVVFLNPFQNGITQISDTLTNYTNLSAVHVVSHGTMGSVQLGNAAINQDSLLGYGEDLQQWSYALREDADLLFYGCNLAATNDGLSLLDQIADWTGADVAASDDLTGNADLGGDWELEYATGNIEAVGLKSDYFAGVLATTSTSGTTLTVTGTQGDDNIVLGLSSGNLTIDGQSSVSLAGISNIAVNAGIGNDAIFFSSALSGYGLIIDGQSGNDTVNFSQDIFTGGKKLTVVAETINVGSGVTLATRNIGTGTDYLNDNSVGNSGNINFTGKSITASSNAQLLAQKTGSYTPGDITLQTDETKDFANVVLNANSSVNLTDAIIKGGNVTLQSVANATNLYTGNEEANTDLENSFNQILADIFSFVGTIPAPVIGAVKADATANINIGGNTTIEGARVNVTANADAVAKILPVSLGLPLAFGYAETNPTANVTVANGATITSTDDLILNSNSGSNVDVTSIAAFLGSFPSLTRFLLVGTGLNSKINATTNVASGATLNVGRDLEVSTVTTKEHQISSSALAYDDGQLAIAVSAGVDKVNTNTYVDGQVTVGGNSFRTYALTKTANHAVS